MIPMTAYFEVKSALNNAVKNLKKGTKKFTRTISFRGGSQKEEVCWNNEKNFGSISLSLLRIVTGFVLEHKTLTTQIN